MNVVGYVPQYALADKQGRWIIEGEGVTPDIEIDNDPASRLAGQDKQLDRAIEELLSAVNAKPHTLSSPAPDPIKTPR